MMSKAAIGMELDQTFKHLASGVAQTKNETHELRSVRCASDFTRQRKSLDL